MAPRTKPECLFEYPSYKRFIHFRHGLPECWSENLSKSWKDAKVGAKKEERKLKELKERKKREAGARDRYY